MRRIHLNDTPATTPEHIAHVAHIADVYRPRTEARRKCQEMREARDTDMLTDWHRVYFGDVDYPGRGDV